ncbi:MAG: PhzF family phenazine biosynthesis protein [Candidatus Sericytochromatia bacterium]|nr:PhzF family phenazine biosynthesis protein [Candidatus Sericytochromatia bacterium]
MNTFPPQKRAYLWLDVFTHSPLSGNPLAVVLDSQGLDTPTMQAIAREFNLSETTFVLPPENPENTCKVRIFTPSKELPFAGHPTLGSAWAVIHSKQLKTSTLLLEEGVGTVPVWLLPDGSLELEAISPPRYAPLPISSALLAEGLGIAAEHIGWNGHQPQIVSCGVAYSLIPINRLETIQKARYGWGPDHPLLQAHPELGEIYLVCPETEDPQANFHVRLFAPGAGVAEDPATGSAAAALGAWLLRHSSEKGPWLLEQGAEIGRPSQLWVRLDGQRIFVRGEVVLVSEGVLTV